MDTAAAVQEILVEHTRDLRYLAQQCYLLLDLGLDLEQLIERRALTP